jgi:hypothetical protein
MLQTDTLRFTQIAQTIDKLVFHLAGEKELGKKLIQLRKKGKFQLKEREEKTIFCRFLNGKNLPFRGSEGGKRSFANEKFIIKLNSNENSRL